LSKAATVSITITKKNGTEWRAWTGLSGQAGINQLVWDGSNQTNGNPAPGQSDYTVVIIAVAGVETSQASFVINIE